MRAITFGELEEITTMRRYYLYKLVGRFAVIIVIVGIIVISIGSQALIFFLFPGLSPAVRSDISGVITFAAILGALGWLIWRQFRRRN